MNFIDKLKGTQITALELFETFKALQLMTKEELTAFWQTIQFTVKTEEKNLNDADKEKIAELEKVIVSNMAYLSKDDTFIQEHFLKMIQERDYHRDPIGLSKVFPSGNFSAPFEDFFKKKVHELRAF